MDHDLIAGGHDRPDNRRMSPDTEAAAADTAVDEGTEQGAGGHGEVDAEFRALLEGLRTSLPGVQVLFAFLLTAPLQGGFADLSTAERTVFATAFFASGTASVLLIAPSVHQRVRAPFTGIQRRSKRHLVIATWVTILGTIAMGVAIVATTSLVSSIVFDTAPAAIATAALAAVLAWAWAFLPLVTFRDRA